MPRHCLRFTRPMCKNTAVTFETAVPAAADFRRRIAATLPRYPYLVAQDARGVAGYAYTGAFVGRAAYADRDRKSVV